MAARDLARLTADAKNSALLAAADAIVASTDSIIAANADDLRRARDAGIGEAMLDRLALDTAGWPVSPTVCVRSRVCPIRSARYCVAPPVPMGCDCARSGCRSGWSAWCTRGARTSRWTHSG